MLKRKQIYKWHKWTAVAAGIFIISQAITGGLWIAGVLGTSPVKQVDEPELFLPDFPLSKNIEIGQPVKKISFENLMGKPVIRVYPEFGEEYLINTRNGKRFQLSITQAKNLIRYSFPDAVIGKIIEIKNHELGYGHGVLPVYKVVFKDKAGTVVYIEPKTATMRRMDNGGRIHAIVVGLHDLSILNLILPSDKPGRLLVIFLSGLTLLAGATGYWLSLPRKRPKKTAKTRSGEIPDAA